MFFPEFFFKYVCLTYLKFSDLFPEAHLFLQYQALILLMRIYYCRANEEWQWCNTLITIAK